MQAIKQVLNLKVSLHRILNRLAHKVKNMPKLETLKFDNLALKSLPIDPETKNYVRTVNGACFSRVEPTPVDAPETVAYSVPAMALLDISEAECKHQDFAKYFAGNKHIPGTSPAAHCYCGHQFGYFAGQLGDGATMYLGEVINSAGERWEIQFKGAGLTPFSRSADGRKVLRSSIREFLCSEAMHHLGIPTTRAGTCITSKSKVVRDIFYSGNPIMEKCTIILRIASTFIRFGSFEIFKPYDARTARVGPSVGRKDILEQMLNYVISTFYPEIASAHEDAVERCKVFYQEVVRRTARLVADWQCVGFCHGVLNTDNMSIVGLTIDYGPFGFMDYFNPDHICNGSDDGGRYSYIKQPEMCQWNLVKLAEAIQSVLPISTALKVLEDNYTHHYNTHYKDKMKKKLGLIQKALADDEPLIEEFLDTMKKTGADFTNSFRGLSRLPLPGSPDFPQRLGEIKAHLAQQCCTLQELKILNRSSIDERSLMMFMALMQSNRELGESIGKGASAFQREMEKRARVAELDNMTEAEKQKQDTAAWGVWLDKYVARLDKEIQGSQISLQQMNADRVKIMNANNPRFILRNYMAQGAIELAENGDYSEVRRILKLLEDPFTDSDQPLTTPHPQQSAACASSSTGGQCVVEGDKYKRRYDVRPPASALSLRVT